MTMMTKKVGGFFRRKINRVTMHAELATKKGRQVFQEKNRGVIPSVSAPGVTRPCDATD